MLWISELALLRVMCSASCVRLRMHMAAHGRAACSRADFQYRDEVPPLTASVAHERRQAPTGPCIVQVARTQLSAASCSYSLQRQLESAFGK